VNFEPTHDGPVAVAVSVLGQPLKDSPYVIAPVAQPNPSQCTAEGKGLEKGRRGQKPSFKIFAKSTSGQPCTGAKFDVEVAAGGEAIASEVKDNGDGTYTVQYHATKPGEYSIAVKCGGHPIRGSPWAPVISDQAAGDKCRVAGLAPDAEAEGSAPTNFSIFPQTADGQPLLDALAGDGKGDGQGGGQDDGLEVYLVPEGADAKGDEARVNAKLEDLGNGEYKVTLPEGLGDGNYQLTAKADGLQLKGFPFNFKIPKGRWGKKAHNNKFTFTVRGLDAKGKAKKVGGGDFKVIVTAPDGSQVSVKTKDKGDGTYYAGYTLKGSVSGVVEYTVVVTLDGVHLLNSPYKQIV